MIRVLIIIVLILILAWTNERDLRDAEIQAKVVREVDDRRALWPCDAQWIRQTSPGDEAFKCVDVDLRDEQQKALPHVLSVPCNFDGKRCR